MPTKKKITKPKPKKKDTLLSALTKLNTALVKLSNKVDALEGKQEQFSVEAEQKAKQVEQKVEQRGNGRVMSSLAAQSDNPFIKPHLVIAEQSKPFASPTPDRVLPPRQSKVRFELWSFDEYNQGSIVQANPDMGKILVAARNFVTEQNVNNALASGEKDKAWEAYFPVVFKNGEPDPNVLYGGNKRNGKHHIYVKGEDKWELQLAPPDLDVRFYLGVLANGRTKTEWYLTNHHGKLITSLDDIMLDRKTVLFVKVI